MLSEKDKIDLDLMYFYHIQKKIAKMLSTNILLLENGYLFKSISSASYNFTKEKYNKYDYSKYKYLINLMHLFNTYLIFVTARMSTKGIKLFNKYSILYKKYKVDINRSIFIVNFTRYSLMIPYKDVKIAKYITKLYDNENKRMY